MKNFRAEDGLRKRVQREGIRVAFQEYMRPILPFIAQCILNQKDWATVQAIWFSNSPERSPEDSTALEGVKIEINPGVTRTKVEPHGLN